MKKKLLAALLAVCMVASMLMPAAAATTSFNDVEEDAWYASSIERWTGYGILNGVGENSFNPEGDMTRAQFAKVVVELLGLPHKDTDMPFEDVMGSDDEWAAGYIAAAYNAGIINGASATRFNPISSKTVSFEQASAILARALGLVGPKAIGDEVTEKLTELGMLDENVNAEADMNRALVAALADKMIGVYVTADNIDDVTEGGVITGEQTGVIVVMPGVRVEIKDATVPAVVAQGGEVQLLGETTVDTVKVGGEYTTVIAEEGTTVGAVTVGGENNKVELNGTVESVVVAADAAGEIDIVVPEDVEVTNESTVDVTVNGETVEGVPAEPEKPDEGETPEESTGEGFVPDQVPTPVPPLTEDPAEENITAGDKDLCGTTDETTGELKDGVAAAHKWVGKVQKEATHEEAGKIIYTCSYCGATTETEIAQLTSHTAVPVSAEVEIDGVKYIVSGTACISGSSCPFDAGEDAEAPLGETVTVGGKTYKWISVTSKTEVTEEDDDGDGEPVVQKHTCTWGTGNPVAVEGSYTTCVQTCDYATKNPDAADKANHGTDGGQKVNQHEAGKCEACGKTYKSEDGKLVIDETAGT